MFSEVTVSEQHSVNKMGTGWHKPMSLQHQCDPNQVCTGNAHVGEWIQYKNVIIMIPKNR